MDRDRTRRAFSPRAAAIALSLATLMAGCTRHATQLMLVIESDLDPSAYACVGIEVARLADGTAVMPSQYVSFYVPVQTGVPFSVGVVPPSGDPSVRVEIRVEARATCVDPNTMPPTDAPIVRTVVRAGFAAEQTLRLPVFLAARCTGVTCDSGFSCVPATGLCEMVREQTPAELMPIRPGQELGDGSSADAGTARDADLVRGQCNLLPGEHLSLTDGAPRVFGLAITRPGNEWVIVYSDEGALHAYRYAYDGFIESAVPGWNMAPGADAIALEGLPDGDELIALVNPTGSGELVRLAGPIGATPTSTSLGNGRLVRNGRHTAVFGRRMATIVERGAGVAVVAAAASGALEDVYVSDTPIELALGNTPAGDLVVAIGGASSCELRLFDGAGVMIGASSAMTGGTCTPRAIERLVDGRFLMVYSDDAQLRLFMSTTPPAGMTFRLSQGAYMPQVAAILGNDATFRVAWEDVYDYPMPPDPGPEEPGIIYWTGFAIGESLSSYTDHGPVGTDHTLTRWERLSDRSAVVMSTRTGFLFRSICRPTPSDP